MERPAAKPATRDAPDGAAAAKAATRDAAELVVQLPSGDIRYYRKGNHFVATCRCEKHQDQDVSCSRKRTANPPRNRSGQGRPLGLLAAWLEAGPQLDSQAAHVHMQEDISFEQRKAARARLLALPNAQRLLEFEREQATWETDSEPFRIV